MSENIAIKKDDVETSDSTSKECENCHAEVQGMYCSQCGQSVESTLKYFWTVVLHLLDDIFSFDSRASRTLIPLIFRPGFLTNEYIAGRRVHYVPPLRLYLFVSIVFFISLKFLSVNDGSIVNIQDAQSSLKKIDQQLLSLEKTDQPLDESEITVNSTIKNFKRYKEVLTNSKSFAEKSITNEIVALELAKINNKENFPVEDQASLDELIEKLDKLEKGERLDFQPEAFTIGNNEDGSFTFDFLSDENNKKLAKFVELLVKKAEKAFTEDSTPLIKEAVEKLPQLMFILLPIFAALLKVMFLFSNRLYLEHLTVALHSHSFIFLNVLLLELFEFLQNYASENYTVISDIAALLSTLTLLWIPTYLFLMQKKVYKQGKALTAFKFMMIGTIYMIMIAITGTIAFIWGLAST